MKSYVITVNGVSYDVTVEETTGGAAPAAAPKAAPRAVPKAAAKPAEKAEAKALLTKYGASRLSEVKEADYAALVAEAEVILND